jgi:hypothetical protein
MHSMRRSPGMTNDALVTHAPGVSDKLCVDYNLTFSTPFNRTAESVHGYSTSSSQNDI